MATNSSSSRRLLPLILTGLLLGAGISQFNRAQATASESLPGSSFDDEGPLAEAMEELQSNMRSLRKMVSDESKAAETIELVRGMQAHVLVAFANVPAAPDGSDAKASARWSIGFRKKMLATAGTMLDIEMAVSTGDHEKASALYKELGAHKKSGHNTYAPDDE